MQFAGYFSKLPRVPDSVALPKEEWDSIPVRLAQAIKGDKLATEWLSPIANEVARHQTPCWLNGFLPGLDGALIYSFIALHKPDYYFEIGSGSSTKFARRAIVDHRLHTKIVSIDPHPRANIDILCDEITRTSLEDCDMEIFDRLGKNDILFMDGSHRCFTNSDVTVFFLDLLPNLDEGVSVGLHDIFIPYDYPNEWVDRCYSEQYLLAACILAETKKFTIELPAMYVSLDKQLTERMKPFWDRIPNVVERHGTSFWIRTGPSFFDYHS